MERPRSEPPAASTTLGSAVVYVCMYGKQANLLPAQSSQFPAGHGGRGNEKKKKGWTASPVLSQWPALPRHHHHPMVVVSRFRVPVRREREEGRAGQDVIGRSECLAVCLAGWLAGLAGLADHLWSLVVA